MSIGGTTTLPLEEIAVSVADAQEDLALLSAGTACQYAIPRTRIEFRFGLRIESQGRFLFLFGRKTAGAFSDHKLSSLIYATPVRPSTPAELPNALEISLPPYLLPADREQDLATAAARAAGKPFVPAQGKDPGCVCFLLESGSNCLVVRLEDNPKKDEIYLYDPDSEAVKPQSTMDYATFRPLFEILREAQRGNRNLPYVYPFGIDRGLELQWGWERFDNLLIQIWESYRAGMVVLSARESRQDPEMYFSIDDFRGEFYYSAWPQPEKAAAGNNYFDANAGWIHNHVVVAHDSRHPSPRIELSAPEFVLSGEVRERLLVVVANDADRVSRECRESLGIALDPVEFQSAPQDVLLLLSYEDEPPSRGFLAVWPTSAGEYLFTFDSDGNEIKEGPSGQAFIRYGDDLAKIDRSAYKAIHNFFRAVRLWRIRKPVG
jgi:hypothetical protein